MIKIVEKNEQAKSYTDSSLAQDISSLSTPIRQTYHELADYPIVETDVLEQLRYNVNRLEDLISRLNFMMKEIRGVMKV